MVANMAPYELERIEAECAAAGVLDEYRAIVARGTPPRAAAMYALQAPAGTRNTDRAFCQGQQRKMENMSPLVRGMLQERAKKAGLDTRGKYYVGGPFGAHDARSWVTSSEDLLTVAKSNNLNLEGVINRKAIAKEPAPKPPVLVAPEILNQLERKAMAADPGLRERLTKNKHARQDFRESLVEKHGRKKHRRKTNLLGR